MRLTESEMSKHFLIEQVLEKHPLLELQEQRSKNQFNQENNSFNSMTE